MDFFLFGFVFPIFVIAGGNALQPTTRGRAKKKTANAFFAILDISVNRSEALPSALGLFYPPRRGTAREEERRTVESPRAYGLIPRREKTVLIRIGARRRHDFSLGFM